MARTYAAIMALLAMLVVLLRALKNHAGIEGTITSVFLWMVLLGLVGLMVGWIARSTVDQSVLKVVEAELTAAAPPSKASAQDATTND